MVGNNRISIVTVSYNAAKTIERTIESVLCQTYSNIEYVIIDGMSMDTTYQIICGYDEKFRNRNITYVHISEADFGIYDAMNKALDYCTGEWILYLNANDSLFQNTTLENVFSREYNVEISCIYGNTWNILDGKAYFRRAYNIGTIYYQVPFLQQATFVKKTVMFKYKFDTVYKIGADYDLFVKMFINGEKFYRINCDIAYYDMLGISQTDKDTAQEEWKTIQAKYGLNKHYRLRKLLRENVRPFLKKNKIIYEVFIIYMNLKEKVRKR